MNHVSEDASTDITRVRESVAAQSEEAPACYWCHYLVSLLGGCMMPRMEQG